MMKKTVSFLLILMLLLPAAFALADDSFNLNKDGYSTSYTYGYDYWRDVQESPDAYRIKTVLDSISLGLENLNGKKLNKPQGLFVQGNNLYVVDTGNNRIIQIKHENEQYHVVRVIDKVEGASVNDFNTPYDVFVDEAENIYVTDYSNHRVVMMDKDLNLIREYTKPSDPTFNQAQDYLPKKLTVDVAGRVYVLATNVNKGLVKYEADGTFTGFIGATPVKYNMAEYLWKRYFQTAEQRAQSTAFVPTEYENLYMDKDGFIYVTTTSFKEAELDSDQAKPIRRLNSLGNDILIKNDKWPPIGDLWWKEADSTYYGPSRMTDITVFDDDIYVALDRIRGRMFGYDPQGVMLWAFGTRGSTDGAFMRAIALEHMDRDLFVLDEVKNNITVFTPTEYGRTIYLANEKYHEGDYEGSAAVWQDVLKNNANYSLAFRGVARSILREDKFEEAMDYYKMAHDRENYGRVFKLYRKEWVEKNIGWIVGILAAVIIIPLLLGRIKRMKWEVIMHEHSKVRREQ